MLSNKTKFLHHVVLVLLSHLLVSCSFISHATTPTPFLIAVGDQPSHIDILTCSNLAQSAIHTKSLPVDLIHSCKAQTIDLDTGRSVSLVTILYGEGMDCPAGCIYNRYVGIYTDEDQLLRDLPDVSIENGMWGRPPFNVWRTWWTENHSSKSVQTVALRNGYYGWVLKLEYYKFTLLYWKSHDSNPQLGKRLYKASGEIFVYLDSNRQEIWDYSRFNTVSEDIQ